MRFLKDFFSIILSHGQIGSKIVGFLFFVTAEINFRAVNCYKTTSLVCMFFIAIHKIGTIPAYSLE
jgi:hypothetical protein